MLAVKDHSKALYQKHGAEESETHELIMRSLQEYEDELLKRNSALDELTVTASTVRRLYLVW